MIWICTFLTWLWHDHCNTQEADVCNCIIDVRAIRWVQRTQNIKPESFLWFICLSWSFTAHGHYSKRIDLRVTNENIFLIRWSISLKALWKIFLTSTSHSSPKTCHPIWCQQPWNKAKLFTARELFWLAKTMLATPLTFLKVINNLFIYLFMYCLQRRVVSHRFVT